MQHNCQSIQPPPVRGEVSRTKDTARAPTKAERRDYAAFAQRVGSLRERAWDVRQLGEVCGLPFFVMERSSSGMAGVPQVLLVGGIHGNEPAGVEAAVSWMESERAEHWPVRWLVLPCANPCGWLHNRRTGSSMRDLNRSFSRAGCCAEIQFIRRALAGRRFLFAMDFHEDSDAPGYYLCEIRTRAPFAGERIVAAVESVLPIWDAPKLDGRKAAGHGWVLRSPVTRAGLARRQHWPLEFHLIRYHTAQTFCSETPMAFPMARRVRAHHIALETALAYALSDSGPGDAKGRRQ